MNISRSLTLALLVISIPCGRVLADPFETTLEELKGIVPPPLSEEAAPGSSAQPPIRVAILQVNEVWLSPEDQASMKAAGMMSGESAWGVALQLGEDDLYRKIGAMTGTSQVVSLNTLLKPGDLADTDHFQDAIRLAVAEVKADKLFLYAITLDRTRSTRDLLKNRRGANQSSIGPLDSGTGRGVALVMDTRTGVIEEVAEAQGEGTYRDDRSMPHVHAGNFPRTQDSGIVAAVKTDVLKNLIGTFMVQRAMKTSESAAVERQ